MYEFIKTETGWKVYWGPRPADLPKETQASRFERVIAAARHKRATLPTVTTCKPLAPRPAADDRCSSIALREASRA